MEPARFLRVKEVFRRALVVGRSERAEVLEAECGLDAALRAEVEELLAHSDAAATGFLGGPAVESAGETPRAVLEIPGYRILEPIATGGAGVVYRAEQTNPRREVAIKVLRLDSLAPGHVARMRREAQILGSLHHAGIAQVFGAGVLQDGSVALPWIAMELVHGLPLDDFVRERALELRDILELLVSVCAAVDHAHQRGVVHRDLKPSNVLVEPSGQPRVLDFGVARVAESDPDVDAPQTRTGALVGTLGYMAPEQARGDRGAIDARADVYALGVMLFELLAGRPPLDVDGLDVLGAARVVCEDEPERLSRARPGLPRDLDAVLAKALEKAPARRYADAGALAEDLQNLLAGRPIRARPPTVVDQIVKAVRRNRALALAGTCVVLALAAGLVVALAALRAESTQRALTSDTLDYFATRLTALAPKLGFGEAQRADLEELAARIERQLATEPASRPLRAALAQTLYELASLDQSRGDYSALRARAERARVLRESLLAQDPGDLASWTHLSQLCAKLGEAARDTGNLDGRDVWFARALEIDERLAREHPDDLDLVEDLGWSLARVSQATDERGDRAQAERLALRRLDDAERIALLQPHNWKLVYNLSHAHYFLAGMREAAGRGELAVQHAHACVRLARDLRRIEPARRDFLQWQADVCRNLAGLVSREGDAATARAWLAEALTTAEDLVWGDPHRPAHLSTLHLAAADHAAPDVDGAAEDRALRSAAALRRAAPVVRRAGLVDEARALETAAEGLVAGLSTR